MSHQPVHLVGQNANRLCWACRRLTEASTQAGIWEAQVSAAKLGGPGGNPEKLEVDNSR